MAKELKDITSNVFKRIFKRDICLPSDYIYEFNQEVKEYKVDIDKVVSEQILEDYKKSRKMIDEAEKVLDETGNILNESINALAQQNKDEVEKLKNDIKLLYNHLNSLNDELFKDDLTKSLNRKWFFHKYLDNEQFTPEDGTMIFIDLDKFKNINDTYGHHIGDKVLILFSNFISKAFENAGYKDKFHFIRFAGDEFIVIVNDKMDNIKNTIKNIKEKMEKSKIIYKNNEIFYIEFSYGMKEFKKGEDIHNIMKEADNNMYHYKSLRHREKNSKLETIEL